MIRNLSFAVLATLLVGAPLLLAPATQAGPIHTGTQINILTHCDQTIQFGVKVPFFVQHGFTQPDWTDPAVTTPAVRRGTLAPTTHFALYFDGALQATLAYNAYDPATDRFSRLWLRNYPSGLTGIHTFTGQWFEDGSLVGGTFGTSVLVQKCGLQVVFG